MVASVYHVGGYENIEESYQKILDYTKKQGYVCKDVSIDYFKCIDFFAGIFTHIYFCITEEMEAVILPLKRETLVFTIAKHNIGLSCFWSFNSIWFWINFFF